MNSNFRCIFRKSSLSYFLHARSYLVAAIFEFGCNMCFELLFSAQADSSLPPSWTKMSTNSLRYCPLHTLTSPYAAAILESIISLSQVTQRGGKLLPLGRKVWHISCSLVLWNTSCLRGRLKAGEHLCSPLLGAALEAEHAVDPDTGHSGVRRSRLGQRSICNSRNIYGHGDINDLSNV